MKHLYETDNREKVMVHVCNSQEMAQLERHYHSNNRGEKKRSGIQVLVSRNSRWPLSYPDSTENTKVAVTKN